MKTIGSFEAKTHLSRLLDEVERGERITITKHGEPVAMLVPIGAGPMSGDDLVKRFARFRAKAPRVSAKEIKRWIDEGRE